MMLNDFCKDIDNMTNTEAAVILRTLVLSSSLFKGDGGSYLPLNVKRALALAIKALEKNSKHKCSNCMGFEDGNGRTCRVCDKIQPKGLI